MQSEFDTKWGKRALFDLFEEVVCSFIIALSGVSTCGEPGNSGVL